MPKSQFPSTSVVLIAAVALTVTAVILELGQIGRPEPLVSAVGWTAPGDIRPLRMAVSNVPQEMQSHRKFSLWTTWTALGTVKGVITSPPFKASRYLAVPFQIGGERGYPDSDRVVLHCNSSGAEIPIATSQSFGGFGEWNVAYIQVPSAFCASDVQIIASSNAARPDLYVGVGTPFSVSRALYLAHSGFGAKALVVAGTCVLFGVIFLAGALSAPGCIDRFGAGSLAIGVAGMAIFLGGDVSAWGARAAAIGCVIVAFFVILRSVITDRAYTTSIVRGNSIPLMAWLALALCLIAFMTGADNTAGRWAANALFSPLSWSTDNELPVIFAQQFAHRTATTPMTLGGMWYFDDRTPLLTTMIVIPQTFLAEPLASLLGSDFVNLADSVAAITILAMWMAVLLWFASKLTVRRPGLFIAIVAISPFMFFNTVYTWGKLLGATYLVIAVGLSLEACKSDEARSNLGLVPAALTFSYLSHAGNAVAGLAFLIVFWSVLRWRDVHVLAIGTIAALAIIAPWGYWTHFIQPGGNALVRFQLADDSGFDRRSVPVLTSVIEYLHSIGWQGWLMMKLSWFEWLFNVNGFFSLSYPVDTQTASFWANQRSLDFVVVSRTIGIASIGVFAALCKRLVRVDFRDQLALRLIGCGALGVVIMILLIVQVGITHDHAYGAIIMIGIGGAMFLADRELRLPGFLFVVWLAYFAYVWIWQPVANADQIHPKSLILAAVWATAVASMAAAWATQRRTVHHLGYTGVPLRRAAAANPAELAPVSVSLSD